MILSFHSIFPRLRQSQQTFHPFLHQKIFLIYLKPSTKSLSYSLHSFRETLLAIPMRSSSCDTPSWHISEENPELSQSSRHDPSTFPCRKIHHYSQTTTSCLRPHPYGTPHQSNVPIRNRPSTCHVAPPTSIPLGQKLPPWLSLRSAGDHPQSLHHQWHLAHPKNTQRQRSIDDLLACFDQKGVMRRANVVCRAGERPF